MSGQAVASILIGVYCLVLFSFIFLEKR